jgi:hypothetical protein
MAPTIDGRYRVRGVNRVHACSDRMEHGGMGGEREAETPCMRRCTHALAAPQGDRKTKWRPAGRDRCSVTASPHRWQEEWEVAADKPWRGRRRRRTHARAGGDQGDCIMLDLTTEPKSMAMAIDDDDGARGRDGLDSAVAPAPAAACAWLAGGDR